MCEDYYSSICDNQLSFSNSPCKSPRTMADMAHSISNNGCRTGGSSSVGNSFTKCTSLSSSHLRERRETLPSCSSHNSGKRNNANVVIVAAKPAKTHAIGFNINATNLASQDSFDINEEDTEDGIKTPASIYYTPSSAATFTTEANENTNTAFVFPQIPETPLQTTLDRAEQEDSSKDCNVVTSAKPLAKYSLNLVIVRECPEPPHQRQLPV
ncbi:hypothetical protein EVAR_71767_1 [Eumeta japonica]|uniref:Uncharacterized protein n=1 Tax=Eumeta variegata TaxID=151549 RepID=A0A4C1T8E3_EUMVA|nr:hypothetical protein EVAR_71767_1 [Eumeta japonica]